MSDLNNDSILDVFDIILLVSYILGNLEDYNHPLFEYSGDINSDQSINILDVLELVFIIMNNDWCIMNVFFVLLGSIGLIYIKTNIFHTNPSLVLLGYKLYRITGEINNKIVVDGGTAIASTYTHECF